MTEVETKSLVNTLHKSYELGGAPLTLIVVGFLIATFGSSFEGANDWIPGVNPTLVFLVGSLFVVFGGFVWMVQARLMHDIHLSMIATAGSLLEEAGRVSKDGANYKVALEDSLKTLPEVFSAIENASKKST